MKVMITGGAGFIGSAVVCHIIEHTQDYVINVDLLTYAGNLESLLSVSGSERYGFEQIDICNRLELNKVLSQHQPDVVMHLAAESHVDRSIDGPAAFVETNIVGTYTLLEAARNYWLNLPEGRKSAFRFHHISTDEVYGDLEDPDELFIETTSYAPSSPDAFSLAFFFSAFVLMCLNVKSWRLTTRAVSLVLFSASFLTSSLLVFYVLPFVFPAYIRKDHWFQDIFFKTPRSIIKWLSWKLDYLLLAFIFFIIKNAFYPPTGMYSGMNAFRLNELIIDVPQTFMALGGYFSFPLERLFAGMSFLIVVGTIVIVGGWLFGTGNTESAR